MNLYRVFIPLFLVLILLTACQPEDVGLLAQQIEAQVTARTPPASDTAIPQPSVTAAEPFSTATMPPTETLTLAAPSQTSAPTDVAPGVTLTVTSTLEPSPPEMVMPVVVTTTDVVTQPWEVRQMRVTESGTIHQATWVGEDRFAVAASDGLYLYQLADLALVWASNLGETVLSLAYLPEEDVLAWGDFKGDIHFYDPQNGQYLATTNGHRLGVTDLTQPPGSTYLFSGSDDGSVRTWVPSFVIFLTIEGPGWMDLWQAPDRVTSVAVNVPREQVVAGSYRRITVWNMDTGDRVWESWELSGWISGVGFSSDGYFVAAADSSNQLKMWSTGDWRLTHDIPIDGCDQITALDFSPQDFRVAIGCKNGMVSVLNGDEYSLNLPGDLYHAAVTDVVYHPDASLLLTSYKDGTLRVWSLETSNTEP